MSEFNAEYTAKIAAIFVNLGAPESQAMMMASQLLKRARQIAQERDISEVEATDSLLKQVIEARQGP